MSTAADIVRNLDALISDIDDLLSANSIEAVIELIQDLGGGDAVQATFAALSQVLGAVRNQLARLIDLVEEPLRHANALAGLLGLLEPLAVGLGQLVETSADALADAGLDEVLELSEPMSQSIDFAGDVLEVGQGVLATLPAPADLTRLTTDFDRLIDTVDSYVEAAA